MEKIHKIARRFALRVLAQDQPEVQMPAATISPRGQARGQAKSQAVSNMQAHLNSLAKSVLKAPFGREHTTSYQKRLQVSQDGWWGKNTNAALVAYNELQAAYANMAKDYPQAAKTEAVSVPTLGASGLVNNDELAQQNAAKIKALSDTFAAYPARGEKGEAAAKEPDQEVWDKYSLLWDRYGVLVENRDTAPSKSFQDLAHEVAKLLPALRETNLAGDAYMLGGFALMDSLYKLPRGGPERMNMAKAAEQWLATALSMPITAKLRSTLRSQLSAARRESGAGTRQT